MPEEAVTTDDGDVVLRADAASLTPASRAEETAAGTPEDAAGVAPTAPPNAAGEVDITDAAEAAAERAATGVTAGERSVTEQGWDGWPTPETPNYLIPKMGEVPVSSTVHFQTVAMTSLHDNRLGTDLWLRLREPIMDGLRQKAADDRGPVDVTKAVYGVFNEDEPFPSTEPVNVTHVARSLQSSNHLSFVVTNALLGDPAPGARKRLRVHFHSGDDFFVREAAEDESFTIDASLDVTQATFGDHSGRAVADVTESLRSLTARFGLGAALRIQVDTDAFAAEIPGFDDPAPGVPKTLRVEYNLGGDEHIIEVREHGELSIGGPLEIDRAEYGELPPEGAIDVTHQVASLTNGDWLDVAVENTTFGFDPAPNISKRLIVHYQRNGQPEQAVVNEHDTLTVSPDEDDIDPTEVHQTYFQPEPENLTELVERLVAGGLRGTHIDPDAIYDTLEQVLLRSLGIHPNERLDPVEHAVQDAVDMPAEGVILYHEQGWYGRGLSLGNLLHSVALAPGEVTQIAVTSWHHATRATDQESVSQQDRTTASTMQNRAVSEIQNAAAQQHEWGTSDAESTAVSRAKGKSSIEAHAKMGFFASVKGDLSGTSQSFGSSHNVSTAVTQTAGDKNVAMSSNQKVNEATKRHAEAARTRRAAAVREVSQTEAENLTTRVLANYNHMHALTMMYFEVVEVFSLRTRVVDAERVLFLPFVVRDVADLVPEYGAALIEAAAAAGRYDLARAIELFRSDDDGGQVALGTAVELVKESIQTAETNADTNKAELLALANKRTTARGTLEAELEQLNRKRADVVAAMSNLRELAPPFASFASRAVGGQLHPIEEAIEQTMAQRRALDQAETHERRLLEQRRTQLREELDDLRAELSLLTDTRALITSLAQRDARGPFHENRLFFNHAVWLSLSSSEVLSLAMRKYRFGEENLAEQIDPAPVSISGNLVGYRWRFADDVARADFKRQYVHPFVGDPEQELATVEADIAVPTGGVFGEAVLGESVSAEKIDLSRFWNWQDSMIPILPTSIDPLHAASPTMQNLDPTPQGLDESSARLDPLRDLPAPTGVGAVGQLMQAQMFRDMSGQGMLQSLAEATTAAAASSEENAAQIASSNLHAGLDFVSDMADKAMTAVAAAETGGASLLGGMTSSGKSSGASILGGVLNANKAGGNGDVLNKMMGRPAAGPVGSGGGSAGSGGSAGTGGSSARRAAPGSGGAAGENAPAPTGGAAPAGQPAAGGGQAPQGGGGQPAPVGEAAPTPSGPPHPGALPPGMVEPK